MTKRHSRPLTRLLLGALLLSSAHASSVIKIASLSPLSGPQSDQGSQIRNGASLAVDAARAQFARLGFDLQFVSYDDQADPTAGTSAARRIAADKDIFAVVGAMNSGVIIPATDAVAGSHVAFVSPSTTNPKVTERGLSNVNRICARDDAQGPSGANFLIGTLHARSVYLLNDRAAYGQGLVDQAIKTFQQKGIKILGNEGTEEKNDFSAIINKIALLKPDAIYFGGQYGQVGAFAKQLREKGITTPIMGGDGLDSTDILSIAGEGARGIYFTTIAPPVETVPAAKNMVARYKSAFRDDAQGYAIMGYDSAQVIIAALLKSIAQSKPAAPTRVQVEAAVRGVNVTAGMLTGNVRFNSIGDRTHSTMYIRSVGSDLKFSTAGKVAVRPDKR